MLNLVCEIKVAVELRHPFTGGDERSLGVRGDRDTLGTSVRGDGLWSRKGRFQLISPCINLSEMLIKFEILCSNTSEDLVKLLVAIKLTGKAKPVME